MTFTTDFGFRDGYVGAMKGVVLSLAPAATLVDVTHGISPRDVEGGALALAQAAPLYPRGTIHVAVVDPGVGADRDEIVVETEDAVFVGPDNGVFSLAARAPRRVFRIQSPAFRREPVSPTFHGRDVFATTAGQLAAGASPSQAGPELPGLRELPGPPLARGADGVTGAVVHVDAFGNLITSIPGDWLTPDMRVEVQGAAARVVARRGRTYADVSPGQLIAYVGSGGQLEIAVRDGSAEQVTGAGRGSAVTARRES